MFALSDLAPSFCAHCGLRLAGLTCLVCRAEYMVIAHSTLASVFSAVRSFAEDVATEQTDLTARAATAWLDERVTLADAPPRLNDRLTAREAWQKIRERLKARVDGSTAEPPVGLCEYITQLRHLGQITVDTDTDMRRQLERWRPLDRITGGYWWPHENARSRLVVVDSILRAMSTTSTTVGPAPATRHRPGFKSLVLGAGPPPNDPPAPASPPTQVLTEREAWRLVQGRLQERATRRAAGIPLGSASDDRYGLCDYISRLARGGTGHTITAETEHEMRATMQSVRPFQRSEEGEFWWPSADAGLRLDAVTRILATLPFP